MTGFTGYWTMRLLCARYECCRQTIYRWMDRRENPFPRPAFEDNGINRWSIVEVLAWEESKKAQKCTSVAVPTTSSKPAPVRAGSIPALLSILRGIHHEHPNQCFRL